MTVLTMARPARHPNSPVLYFRKAIRERAGMREFKRTLGTADTREAKKRHAAVAAEYDALIERLEAPPRHQLKRSPPRLSQLLPEIFTPSRATSGDGY